MVNLEALANDLRASGVPVAMDDEDDSLDVLAYNGRTPFASVSRDGGVSIISIVVFNPTDYPLRALAIIARHLGAGQPVAADRAALVERVKADIEMFLGDWLDASYGPYDQLAQLSVSAVEAAGWGPRAEPVAAGETLYRKCPHCPGDGTSCWTCDDEGYVPVALPDDRTVNCHVCGEYIGVRFGEVYTPGDDICTTCIAELAALPARFAVPVEGA